MGLKNILAGTTLVVALLSGGCGEESRPLTQEELAKIKIQNIEREKESIRKTAISYMIQPKFSNTDFLRQISGTNAEIEVLNQTEGMLYFRIPPKSYFNDTLSRLSNSPDKVEFAKSKDGNFQGSKTRLGRYIFDIPDRFIFRFPAEDFKVDSSSTIKIPFASAEYIATIRELGSFIDNTALHRGYLNAEISRDRFSSTTIANHGAYVARPGEKSLERLVNSLTDKSDSAEDKAQKLLTFVTNDLTYSFSDANSRLEVLKRPNEVLMTRGSDCSGKAILYASLLEQAGIDYRLAYDPGTRMRFGHITVGVEGNYGNRNGLTFKSDGKTFSIAEPTTRHFDIGDSFLDGKMHILYTQDPAENSKIYNHKTGEPLPFR